MALRKYRDLEEMNRQRQWLATGDASIISEPSVRLLPQSLQPCTLEVRK